MNSAVDFIVALSILFGTGIFGINTIKKLEGAAKIRIQKGLPPLSPFTAKLTCVSYDDRTGEARVSTAKHCHK